MYSSNEVNQSNNVDILKNRSIIRVYNINKLI